MRAQPTQHPNPYASQKPNVADNAQTVLNLVLGNQPGFTTAMLSTVMADTLGMSMHNAITQQNNAQVLNSASTTSACSRILSAAAPIPFNTKPMYPQGDETGQDGNGAPLDLKWPCDT